MAPLTNEFSWSASRDRTFDECRRKYWFTHYGSWGGWEADADPQTREIYLLRKLQNRWMWAGNVVHRAIARVLEEIRAGGRPAHPEVDTWLLETMRQEYRRSRRGEYRIRPSQEIGLVEHEYGERVPDQKWQQLTADARQCVRVFFEQGYPDRFAAVAPDAWLTIEGLDSFVLDGVKVWVKLDAALRERAVTIFDWKTGRGDVEPPDSLQMGCYALYALSKGWASRPEEIQTVVVHLAQGRRQEQRARADWLQSSREHIGRRAAQMQALHLLPREHFPVTDDPRHCAGCAFRRVCPDRPAR